MVYRQIMNADALSSVITVPQTFRNKRVEVIIREAPDVEPLSEISKTEIRNMMSGSITQSLIGIISDNGMTLDDYRAERLAKSVIRAGQAVG